MDTTEQHDVRFTEQTGDPWSPEWLEENRNEIGGIVAAAIVIIASIIRSIRKRRRR